VAATESQQFSNISATTLQFPLRGGKYGLDISATTGNPGGNGFGGNVLQLFDIGIGTHANVNFLEGGLWCSGFTTPQQSSMNSNQHSYWGF
jgi:hypothetical protein